MRIILPAVIAAPPGCQPPSFRARGRDLHHPPPDASSRATHRRALRGPFLHGATFSLSEEEPASVEMSGRSEEHTSELQSLMRISYAVFCLQKKNKRHDQPITADTL